MKWSLKLGKPLGIEVYLHFTFLLLLALINCLSALTLMAGLTGCAGHRHSQSAGQRVDDPRAAERGYNQITDQGIADSRMAERVREALASGFDYKYDEVTVMVGNGGVQLSGLVNTGAQKLAAEEVASKVPGVKSVQNNLMVND
jgi:osmotically-inducible protein OsmY